MQLEELGDRICILGPSNSGKSTLTEAIARKRDLAAVHIDQLYHLPNTDWKPRAREEFIALHDAMIAGDRWVIDGNYTITMPQRFARATGLILLDISTPASLLRYFRRTLFQSDRAGALEGNRDSVKWAMIHHIAVVTPSLRRHWAALYKAADLSKIRLQSVRAIKQCYRDWQLD